MIKLLARLLIVPLMILSCDHVDDTTCWVKYEMGYVGVEDSPITISITTPQGMRDFDVNNGWYSEEFGPFTTGDIISMEARKEGDGYFVYKIYVSQDGSFFDLKSEKTCSAKQSDNLLRIVL